MCTADDGAPVSVADALRTAHACLDYLNGPDAAGLPGPALGDVLVSLGELQSKFTAAHAGFLRRFDAADAHDADGYPTSASWLAARTRTTLKDARADVRRMRQLSEHPGIADALAAGQISASLAREMADWTRKLPAELRAETEQILLDAAVAGADLHDLAVIAAYALHQWRSQHPDPDDDGGFDDRYIQLGITFDGAGVIRGNLTPECAAAVSAVLEALGKKRGPQDTRTAGQRFHDALQEGCELLIRAKMVPDRAGADTHVNVHVPLSALRQLPGAPGIEAAFLAAAASRRICPVSSRSSAGSLRVQSAISRAREAEICPAASAAAMPGCAASCRIRRTSARASLRVVRVRAASQLADVG